MLNFAESGHPKFRATSACKRSEMKSKGKVLKYIHFNSSDDTSAQCLRSSSGCVGRNSQRHEVRGNAPRMKIWNQWLYRQNFLLLTLLLRLMTKYKETCCVNTSRNSQNFLNNRN